MITKPPEYINIIENGSGITRNVNFCTQFEFEAWQESKLFLECKKKKKK